MSATDVESRSRKPFILTLMLLGASWLSLPAYGQAVAAATRTMGFDVFGGVSELKLDYGSGYNKYSTGFALGGDVIRHYRLFELGIEPRFGHTVDKHNVDTQSYFLGDLVLSRSIGRFHPYGVAGIGYGKIDYHPKGQDDSIVYSVGPGLQYDVTSHWSVKGDWQYQFWDVGNPGKETGTFNPHGFTISAVYRLRFGRS